ncbi:MAG: alkaline phosphatase family protein [bacterium]
MSRLALPVKALLIAAASAAAAPVFESAWLAHRIAALNSLALTDLARLFALISGEIWVAVATAHFAATALALAAAAALFRGRISTPAFLVASVSPAVAFILLLELTEPLEEIATWRHADVYWRVSSPLIALPAAFTLAFYAAIQMLSTLSRKLLPRTARHVLLSLLLLSAVLASAAYLRAYPSPGKSRLPVRVRTQTGRGAILTPGANVRVFFIGVDGATWDVIGPLAERGVLKNIAGLVERGSHGRMRTLKPTLSPLIWTTIATGLPPERHGIGGFVEYEVEGLTRNLSILPGRKPMKFWRNFLDGDHVVRTTIKRTSRSGAAVWNVLSAAGLSVNVVRWPVSFPPERVNGRMVTHRTYYELRGDPAEQTRGGAGGAEREITTSPPDFVSEIAPLLTRPEDLDPSAMSRFVVVNELFRRQFLQSDRYDKSSEASILKFIHNEDEFFNRVALYVLDNYPSRFFSLYIYGLDAVQHYFWKYMKPEDFSDVDPAKLETYGGVIRGYYEYVDETIGKILERADENTVVIVASDHGMESVAPEGAEGFRSGSHSNAPDGIFIIAGKGINRRAHALDVRPADVLPTILRIFGVPAARDVAGKTLDSALDEKTYPERKSVRSYEWTTEWTGGRPGGNNHVTENEMIERLKNLGYIK